jgi:hypothetical protein
VSRRSTEHDGDGMLPTHEYFFENGAQRSVNWSDKGCWGRALFRQGPQ